MIDLLLQKCWVKIILFWINLKALKERTKTKGKEISEITELLTFDSVSGFLLSELNCVNFADLPVGNVFVVFFLSVFSRVYCPVSVHRHFQFFNCVIKFLAFL